MDDFVNDVQKYFPNATETDLLRPAQPETYVRRAAAGPRLDLWTHKRPSSPHVELTVLDCGNGNVEATATIRQVGITPGKKKTGKRKGVGKTRETMSEVALGRSAGRAQKKVRLSSKVMAADRLLTLTSRKYLYTRELAWRAFKEFNRLMTLRFRARWKYVAVPELHPKNEDHYHIHCAISGHYNVNTVRLLWRQALRNSCQEAWNDHAPGNIDIEYKSNKYDRVNGVAKYIAKYITKAPSLGNQYEKRYEKSRGLEPEKTMLFVELGATDLQIMRKVQDLSSGVFTRMPVWKCIRGYDVLLMETGPDPDALPRSGEGGAGEARP